MFTPTTSRRLVAVVTTLAAVGAATGMAASTATAAPTSRAGSKSGPTYAFFATGWGTKAQTTGVDGRSGRTALSIVACTNRTGKKDANSVTSATLPGDVEVGNVETVSRSYKTKKSVHSSSENQINRITIAGAGDASLRIKAFSSRAHSWHNKSGFHSSVKQNATLLYTPVPDAPPIEIPFPGEGETVDIPGFGSVKGPQTQIRNNKHSTLARGLSLRIDVNGSETIVKVGRVRSSIRTANPFGLMHGKAFGSTSSLLDGTVTSGRTALQLLRCPGTGGKVRENTTATFGIPDAGDGGATVSRVSGLVKKSGAIDAWTRSTVASFDLGGQAALDGIKAKANVHRRPSGKIKSNAHGTSPGTITLAGETEAVPIEDGQEIPGVAKFRTNVVEKTRRGIKVVALRIRFMPGTPGASVIDLGNASVSISKH